MGAWGRDSNNFADPSGLKGRRKGRERRDIFIFYGDGPCAGNYWNEHVYMAQNESNEQVDMA